MRRMERGLVEDSAEPAKNLCLYEFCASLESNICMENLAHRHLALFKKTRESIYGCLALLMQKTTVLMRTTCYLDTHTLGEHSFIPFAVHSFLRILKLSHIWTSLLLTQCYTRILTDPWKWFQTPAQTMQISKIHLECMREHAYVKTT